MNVFTFVVVLVTVVMCARLIQVYLENRGRSSDDEFEQTIAKIDALEERIQVLERIITENRFDLKQKIDNL